MTREEAEKEIAEIDKKIEEHKNDIDICPRCGKIYCGSASKVCLRCRCYIVPYNSLSSKERLNAASKSQQIYGSYSIVSNLNTNITSNTSTDVPANIPRCPTCQSTNIKKISFAKGYLHWRMLGVFSKTAMSQWECKSCGSKW